MRLEISVGVDQTKVTVVFIVALVKVTDVI